MHPPQGPAGDGDPLGQHHGGIRTGSAQLRPHPARPPRSRFPKRAPNGGAARGRQAEGRPPRKVPRGQGEAPHSRPAPRAQRADHRDHCWTARPHPLLRGPTGAAVGGGPCPPRPTRVPGAEAQTPEGGDEGDGPERGRDTANSHPSRVQPPLCPAGPCRWAAQHGSHGGWEGSPRTEAPRRGAWRQRGRVRTVHTVHTALACAPGALPTAPVGRAHGRRRVPGGRATPQPAGTHPAWRSAPFSPHTPR